MDEDDDSSGPAAARRVGAYGLRPIQIGDKSVFDHYLSCCATRLSDYTFANTFIWREPIHLRWAVLRDCLCVFANGNGGLTLLFPPLGEGDPLAALRGCLEICDDYNAAHRFEGWTRVEYVSREMLRKLGGTGPAPMPIPLEVRPMSGDYVYETQRMIDLAGGDLASKRQARNRFARRHEARTEPYGPHHLFKCLELLSLWNQQVEQAAGQSSTSAGLKRNKDVAAAREALLHCEALGLKGMVLYAGDQIVGFTLGEILDEATCSIIIEKTDRQFAGSAQYIFSEFCRQFWAHTRWCNVGDDWDVPSLAWTKESYRPAMRLEKFILRPAPAGRAVAAETSPAAAVPIEHTGVQVGA